jgi:hypothetical protein
MPGLTLTVRQASRLFGLEQDVCRQVVERLVHSDFLPGPPPASWHAAIAEVYRKTWPRAAVPGMPPPARFVPARRFLIRGLRPSDSSTCSLARRFDAHSVRVARSRAKQLVVARAETGFLKSSLGSRTS